MAESSFAAMLFTDLVDSTGLIRARGDDAAHALSQEHLSLLRSAVTDHGGREVKSLGDGLMVEFTSVVAALRSGVDMQRAAAGHTLGRRLRVGIEAGEPIRQGDDLFGTPVVVAKRLCDLASGGQIIASDLVLRLAAGRADFPSTALGPVSIKGLDRPVEAVSVGWEETAPAAGGTITVVVADDQRLVRGGFRVILEAESDMTVVGEASDGLEAVELVRRYRPTVALLDIRMPNMDGLQAARRIMEESTETRVVILTTFDADEYVYEALRAGASGFLLKDAPADQLLAAVRAAAAGQALIDPTITRRLIGRFALAARPAPDVPERLSHLTSRELDVFGRMARGLSNSEIARELVLEENTVKTHVSRILMKLDLRDRVQAVVLAYETGFARPEQPNES